MTTAWCEQQLYQRARTRYLALSRPGLLIARRTTAGWATGDLIAHDAGKQAAAIDTAAAMEGIGQMVLLVRRAPHGHTVADPAEVNRLLACALRHLAPVTIADPAEVVTEIADDHLDIRAFIFVAHRVHPRNTRSTAPQCAAVWQETADRHGACDPAARRRPAHHHIVAHGAEESSPFLYKSDSFYSRILDSKHKLSHAVDFFCRFSLPFRITMA
jgi:hypothetical protein